MAAPFYLLPRKAKIPAPRKRFFCKTREFFPWKKIGNLPLLTKVRRGEYFPKKF